MSAAWVDLVAYWRGRALAAESVITNHALALLERSHATRAPAAPPPGSRLIAADGRVVSTSGSDGRWRCDATTCARCPESWDDAWSWHDHVYGAGLRIAMSGGTP